MLRRTLLALVVLVTSGAASVATNASADVKTESAAYSAMQKAQKDFVAKKYAAGIAKLQKAITACGTKKCSDDVRANLLRDLGAQQLRKGNKAGAQKAWAAALKLSPGLSLSATYDVQDVRQAFDEASGGGGSKAAAGGAGAGAGEGTSTGTGAAGGGGTSAPPAEKAEKAEGEKPEGEKAEGGEKGGEKTGEKTEGAGEGEKPAENAEEGGAKKFHRFWLGLAGTLDLAHLPGGKDLCMLNSASQGGLGLPKNTENYYCTWNGGQDFPPRHLPASDPNSMINGYLQSGKAGNVSDSFALGNVRLLLAFDYAATQNILLGARIGVSFLTYPGSAAASDGKTSGFGRLHAELRASYLFGGNPLGPGVVAPLVFVGGGISEFDAHATDTIVLSGGAGHGPVDIWRTDGPVFVAVGAGVRMALTDTIAGTAALRGNFAFGPVFMPTVGPELGLQYGF